jgi:hypothetical protein
VSSGPWRPIRPTTQLRRVLKSLRQPNSAPNKAIARRFPLSHTYSAIGLQRAALTRENGTTRDSVGSWGTLPN